MSLRCLSGRGVTLGDAAPGSVGADSSPVTNGRLRHLTGGRRFTCDLLWDVVVRVKSPSGQRSLINEPAPLRFLRNVCEIIALMHQCGAILTMKRSKHRK